MVTPRSAAKRIAALTLGVSLVLSPLPAGADARPNDAVLALTGIGSVLATLVYAPFKLTHAVTGTVISGLAWVSTGGDNAVASTIFRTAVGGDYVVTPSHLRGKSSFRLRGDAY